MYSTIKLIRTFIKGEVLLYSVVFTHYFIIIYFSLDSHSPRYT